MAGRDQGVEADSIEDEFRADYPGIARFAMIVLDASLVVELITNGERAVTIRADLAGREHAFIAPELLDIEVVSAIRRMVSGLRTSAVRRDQLLSQLEALPVTRYTHTPLIGRIWELRNNFTAYDAAYIALAEATNSALYTCDAKLSKGHRARVVIFR